MKKYGAELFEMERVAWIQMGASYADAPCILWHPLISILRPLAKRGSAPLDRWGGLDTVHECAIRMTMYVYLRSQILKAP